MGFIITAVIWARWTIWAARTVWTDWFIVDVAFSGKNPVDFADAMHIFIVEHCRDFEFDSEISFFAIGKFAEEFWLRPSSWSGVAE